MPHGLALRLSMYASLVGSLLLPLQVSTAAGAEPVYAADLKPLFPTEHDERVDREHVDRELADFAAKPPLGSDAAAIDAYLHQAERLLAELQRHEAYLHLRSSIDTGDHVARSSRDEVEASIAQVHALLDSALQNLSPDDVAAAFAARPSLVRYEFVIARTHRRATHRLPADRQRVLDELSNSTASTLADLYGVTLRTTGFLTVDTPQGRRNVWSDRQALAVSPDRSVRQQAAQGLIEGLASRADIYAAILLGVVRQQERAAQLQGFEDAPSAIYLESLETPSTIKARIASVAKYADLALSYQNLRARHASSVIGASDVHSWDLTAPMPGFEAPRYSIDEATKIALQSAAPLGRDYVEQLRQLLRPDSGRSDVRPGGGTRSHDGFSTACSGTVPSMLFVGEYSGFLGSVRRLAHEGGHAIHGQLMCSSGVSPIYMEGPQWMSEAFAIFNELLLLDRMYRTGADARARMFYLEALIDDITFQIFTSAAEGSLEQAIYEGVNSGSIKSAADLDAIALAELGRYDAWSSQEPARKHLWMAKRLMFEDPLYLVNYLRAGLLATKMYAMAKTDAADFSRRYLPLLKGGFHAEPDVLLREFFGRDVPEAEIIEDAMRVVGSRIEELAKLYASVDRDKKKER